MVVFFHSWRFWPLHDVNRSGWWVLLLGLFGYFVLLYWFLQPSVRAAEEEAGIFT